MSQLPNRTIEELAVTAIAAVFLGMVLGLKGVVGAVIGAAWAFYVLDNNKNRRF